MYIIIWKISSIFFFRFVNSPYNLIQFISQFLMTNILTFIFMELKHVWFCIIEIESMVHVLNQNLGNVTQNWSIAFRKTWPFLNNRHHFLYDFFQKVNLLITVLISGRIFFNLCFWVFRTYALLYWRMNI